MTQIFVFWLWIATLTGLAVLAVFGRDKTVRRAAALCSANGVLTIALLQGLPHWQGPRMDLFVLDFVTAAAFLWLAMADGRVWCTTAAGFQCAAVALHLAYFSNRSLFVGAYYTGFVVLGYLLAFAIFFGACRSGRPPEG